MKKFFSNLYLIWAFIFVFVSLIVAITIIFETYFYLGLFIFLILGIIAVYLIKRGRKYGSKNTSNLSTCSLCEGEGKVRSTKGFGFISITSPCPNCDGEGYSDTPPTTSDKNKYKIDKSRGYEIIMFIILGVVFLLFKNPGELLNKPFEGKSIDSFKDSKQVFNLTKQKLDFIPSTKIKKNNLVLKSGKKELYDFCEEEGFNTTDKDIKECGLLINKRLLEANINTTDIDTSEETEKILNKLEEQGKIIKKMEQREKVKRAINVYKAYKNLGLF